MACQKNALIEHSFADPGSSDTEPKLAYEILQESEATCVPAHCHAGSFPAF